MNKYLKALEIISDILRSNEADAIKIKKIGDAVDNLNSF